MAQVRVWITNSHIRAIAVQISTKQQVVERWEFNLNLTQSSTKIEKSNQQTTREIGALLRQITASVSFLPVLDSGASFNVLAYTATDAPFPSTWVDAAQSVIADPQVVELRSFTTDTMRVGGMVTYAVQD